MNCVMGLKSLLHLWDDYRFLPHRGVVWETHKWADSPAECCETQRDEPEGSALCGETLHLLPLLPFSQSMDC